MGGICCCGPRKRASTASTAARSAATGAVATTWPELSWVSVSTPSRSPAMYSFSADSKNSTALVALPTKMGRTPVAMGSKVPPWPMRLSRSTPRSLAATSWLVQSAGLSIIKIPVGMGPPLLPKGLILAQHGEQCRLAFGQRARDRRTSRRGMAAAAQGGAVGGGIVARRRAD